MTEIERMMDLCLNTMAVSLMMGTCLGVAQLLVAEILVNLILVCMRRATFDFTQHLVLNCGLNLAPL